MASLSTTEILRPGVIQGQPCFCDNCTSDGNEQNEVSRDHGDDIFIEELNDEDHPVCEIVENRLSHAARRNEL
jgi:hypothetical protein